MRDERPVTPTGTNPATPSQPSTPALVQNVPKNTDAPDEATLKAQEEFIRAMLRAQTAESQQNAQGQAQQEPEDPMLNMLGSLMGGLKGEDGGAGPGGLPFSPDDISKATGLPSFVTNMMMGQQKTPPSPAEVKSIKFWKIVHVVFAVLAGIYLVFTMNRSITTFGVNPPAPATFKNPFVVFATGELILHGTRIATASTPNGRKGTWLAIQILKELGADGFILIFMIGIAGWWKGTAWGLVS